MSDTMGSHLSSCYLLENEDPKDYPIETEGQGRGEGQGSHVELAAMFFGKLHTINTNLVKVFKPWSYSSGIKEKVGHFLVELKKLWELWAGVKNASRMARWHSLVLGS